MEKLYDINVDIKNNGGLYTGFVQYDNKTNILNITLSEGMSILELGKFSELYCLLRRPDSKVIKLPCKLDKSCRDMEVTLTDGSLSVPGIVTCEIKIINEDLILTSGEFYLEVRESVGLNGESFIKNPFLVGKDGKDGHTPIVGIDFFTEEDKQDMIDRIGKMSVSRITESEISIVF